jgi:hypothetical protein
MTDRLEQLLAARFGELQASTGEPDWADVRRKAHRVAARKRGLRLGTGLAAALVAVLAATPAFGLQGQIVQLFSGGEPAPAPVVESFGQMDVGAPPGMAPGVIAGEARKAMEVPLSTGKTWILWVAPTRSGGFCTQFGCDRDRQLPFAPGMTIPGSISPQGKILEPPVIFDGDTLIHGATTVKVLFEDGSSATTPVVWVSEPIDAGFFVYEVPQANWQAGHRPTAIVLEDADGKELARDTVLASHLAEIQRPGGLLGQGQ